MIRNDAEYSRAKDRLEQERRRLELFREQFSAEFSFDQVARLMAPLISFYEQLSEEIGVYERLKRGDLGDLKNLHGLGRLLVHLRVATGLTQRDLAEKLSVHESQVSRDERNEYHGITLERASKIMDALGANVRTQVVAADQGVAWAPAFEKAREISQRFPTKGERGERLMPTEDVHNADFANAA